jgi:hypothetical protein
MASSKDELSIVVTEVIKSKKSSVHQEDTQGNLPSASKQGPDLALSSIRKQQRTQSSL